jgi:hypothetical protein
LIHQSSSLRSKLKLCHDEDEADATAIIKTVMVDQMETSNKAKAKTTAETRAKQADTALTLASRRTSNSSRSVNPK